MKHPLLYMAFLLAAPAFVACGDDDAEPAKQQLAVTNHNLSGQWKALSWKGQAMPEGTYVYISFVRRGQTFTMVQNLGSMYPQTYSGTYSLTEDKDAEQWKLEGKYDFDGGEWAHSYYVSSLYADEMTLTATDDASDVTLYVRCDTTEVPRY